MRIPIAVMLAFLPAAAAIAQVTPQGVIMLLPSCPADQKQPAAQDEPQESAATAVLTPLITGAIGNGLKALGAHLQEVAAEQQVDALYTGDYFFMATDIDKAIVGLKTFCVIAATKSVVPTSRSLAQLVSEYRGALYRDTNGARRIADWSMNGPEQLVAQLQRVGYTDALKPGVLVVFDVDVSVQRSHARLVPRYVVMDHSVREKRADAKPRDITFEVVFTAASAPQAFGREVFKFDGLVVNSARRRQAIDVANPVSGGGGALLLPGQWFGLPAMDAAAQDRLTKWQGALAKVSAENQTSTLALAAVKRLDGQMPSGCPAADASLEGWAIANADLVTEQGKPQAQQNATRLALATQKVTFYSACMRMRESENVRDALAVKQDELFLAFDLAMNVKEFRERPAAKFFGDLLSDEGVSSGVTTALVNAVDPATRAAAAEQEEAERVAAREKFEQAVLDAEKAALDYAAADAASKDSKRLDMEFKRRTANRLADGLNLPRPYPADGVWYTG